MSDENTNAQNSSEGSETAQTAEGAQSAETAQVDAAIRELQQQSGMTPGDVEAAQAVTDEVKAGESDKPEGQPENEPEGDTKPEEGAAKPPEGRSRAELYERLAKRDADVHRERSARLEAEDRASKLEERVKSAAKPPSTVAEALAYMREHVPGGFKAVAQYVVDNGAQSMGNAPKGDESPAMQKIAELERKLAEREESEAKTRSEQQAQQLHAQQLEAVGAHVKERTDVELLNGTGRYDLVLHKVQQHYGSKGTPESEREAAEIVAYYAKEVERELQADAAKLVENPVVKRYLSRLLGSQNEEPARQEIEGARGDGNGAPPDLSDLATKRHAKVEDLDEVPIDELLRRTEKEVLAQLR